MCNTNLGNLIGPKSEGKKITLMPVGGEPIKGKIVKINLDARAVIISPNEGIPIKSFSMNTVAKKGW